MAALAYHFAEAGTDPARAARYWGLAAEQAEQRFAYHEAVRLWEQALTCLDQIIDAAARDRLELVLGLVSALAHTGQVARARSLRKEAVRAALPLGDPVLVARVVTAFDVPRGWFSHEYTATDDELVATVEQTLASLPPGDGPLRCRLLTTLAFELEGAESERGYQASADAVQMARRLGDADVLTMAISGRYFQTYRHDGLAERQALGAELLALPGKPVTAEALAHLTLMVASCGAADFAVADRHADQAAYIAARYDLPTVAAAASTYRALRAALDGDLTGAAELYQQAAAAIDRLGLWWLAAGMSALGRFSLLVMQDRVGEMAGDLERAVQHPRSRCDVGGALRARSRRLRPRRATLVWRPDGRGRSPGTSSGCSGPVSAVCSPSPSMTVSAPSPPTRHCCLSPHSRQGLSRPRPSGQRPRFSAISHVTSALPGRRALPARARHSRAGACAAMA